jgi:hypothetical protein
MKKLIQIFQEESGKLSNKRVFGAFGFVLCGIAFVVDGLHFYTINEHLFDSFLTASTVLIGASTITSFAKK